MTKDERIYAAILALVGWCAILLQCYWAVETAVDKGLSLSMGIVNVLSYFTILTNILVAAYLTFAATGRLIASPAARTALGSYILVVGCVYEVSLRRLWNPEGLRFIVDVVLHYVVPLGYFCYWILFVPKQTLRYGAIASWTIYPFAYLFYSLIRGRLYGFFPYPFINYPEIGWPRLWINVALLIFVFVLAGALLIALGRFIVRSRNASASNSPLP